MKLEQSFEVDAPIDRVWQTLIDVEHVAPCLPGAAVTGRNEDGSYNGTFTVKIGPTTASYTGKLEMENIDEASHTATMNAQGTDKRGQGGAKATILSRLAPADGRGTRVEVVTDYHITGRLARFGRGGMIEDISERLLKEFAKRLQSSLAAQPETYAAPAAAAEAVGAAPAAAAEAVGADARAAAEAVGAQARAEAETAGAEAGAAAETAAAGYAAAEPPATESMRSADTVVSSAPESRPPEPPTAGPPTEVAQPAPEAVSPPAPEPAVSASAEPAVFASAEPAPPAPPAPEPPPVAPPPPPSAVPPPPPSAAQPPPLENPPLPSEPMQGLSLMGSVVWGRVKRNPAPVAAAGVAVVLLMARRRRRRHGH